MKKILYVVMAFFALTGCGMMDNTPTKKVEALLHKYQMNDSEVITDLDNVLLMDSTLTDDERKDYSDFMKKHYQDLTYKIKEEKIDGDSATVDVEITVRDYSEAMNDANNYRMNNSGMFDDSNSFASYRLDRLKEVSKQTSYTLTFHLTKVNDTWQVEPLSSDDESKINGLYGVNDIIVDTTDDETAEESNSVDENTTDNSSIADDTANSSQDENNMKE